MMNIARAVYRLTRMRSCHVTLSKAEFQLPNFAPVGRITPGGLTLNSAPNF